MGKFREFVISLTESVNPDVLIGPHLDRLMELDFTEEAYKETVQTTLIELLDPTPHALPYNQTALHGAWLVLRRIVYFSLPSFFRNGMKNRDHVLYDLRRTGSEEYAAELEQEPNPKGWERVRTVVSCIERLMDFCHQAYPSR